jgi:isoleucyl-tRNA synthetase
LISLTKLIAPILSFTAEELWKHIPGEKEESVFLSDFPEFNPEYEDAELETKWEHLIKFRDEVNKALELKRQEKFIGNALEAKVKLFVDKEALNFLSNYQDLLPTIFIVSSVEVINDTASPESALKSSEIDGLSILVEKAEGDKCQRCWNWDITVGKYDKFPDLCKKCHKVLIA